MKRHPARYYTRALLACLLAAAAWGAAAAPPPRARAADKLRPEEIVAKHLEAVGAAETRESVTSRMILGTVVATFRSPAAGQVGGRAVLASKREMNVIGMAFPDNPNYPQEKVGYDGKDVSASYVQPGLRSTLGEFLLSNKGVVKQGLLGGALSASWPLFGPAERMGKLESGGTKTLNGRPAYEVKYFPRGGSDLRVSLFFDAETFQHVRTEYTRTTAAQMGPTPEASAQQSEARYKMVEEFSDFRREGGLSLPHGYRLSLEIRSGARSFTAEWAVTLTQFAFNQKIAPEVFDVDDK
ncbi:MAG TPA: hypothetical protein VF736_08190 [Pyrinomonadaceae bacterium]|jgi:hypothetical protein